MNIDADKLRLINEATGWLKQAEIFYKSLRYEIGDDCVKRARAALDDTAFLRQPIPGYPRDAQPDTIWVKNPVAGGKMLINGSDFNPEIHQVWIEEPTPTIITKRSR
jgi:hypothetical protein